MTHPIPDVALDGRLGIVGLTGSGKTNVAKGGVERLLTMGRRVCVVDLLDAWWGLRVKPDGKSKAFDVAIFGGAHADLPINEHAGAMVGQAVAEATESTIVSLDRLDSDAARRRFARDFFDALHRHNRAPLHLVIDEADFYAPQAPMKGTEHLLNRVKEIASRGRMRGFRAWAITQRPAKLHKDVLSQCDTLVAMQLTASQDRAAIEAWIGDQADKVVGKAILATLPKMKRGQGVLWSPRLDILRPEQFPLSATYDSGRTPEHGEKLPDVALAPLDLGSLRTRLSTVEKEAVENDPRRLKAEVARLTRELAAKPAAAVDLHAITSAEATGYSRGKIDGYAEGIAAIGSVTEPLKRAADAGRAAVAAFDDMQRSVDQWSKRTPKGPPAQATVTVTPRRSEPAVRPAVNGSGDSAVGQGGLRRILIALAQRPDGLTNRQIGVRAGLSSKSGTFSTYLSRGRSSGWIEGSGRLAITPAGVAALGHYDPLPAGQELLNHWLGELGNSGAARLLRVIADAYPNALSNSEAGERAELSHQSGTFSTYLSRLRTLELIEGRGELRASAELFG
jgi:hypothetical protein